MPNWASLLPGLMSCLLIYIVRTFTLLSENPKLFTVSATDIFEPVQSDPSIQRSCFGLYSCLVKWFKSKLFNWNFVTSCLSCFSFHLTIVCNLCFIWQLISVQSIWLNMLFWFDTGDILTKGLSDLFCLCRSYDTEFSKNPKHTPEAETNAGTLFG